MIVRVFVPRPHEPAEGANFSGSDHNFPVLPSIGQVLRFTDERGGDDFTVSKVGFVQNGDAFVAAVWTDGPEIEATDPIEEVIHGDRHEYRDLNYDVPPETMEGY